MSFIDFGDAGDDLPEKEPYTTVSQVIDGEPIEVQAAFAKELANTDPLANIEQSDGNVKWKVPGWVGSGDWYTADFLPEGLAKTRVSIDAFTDGPMAGAIADAANEELSALLKTVGRQFEGRGLS